MSDKQWRIFDDGDREFTGDYDVWIGTGGDEDGDTGEIIAACFRDHARLIAAAPDLLAAAVGMVKGEDDLIAELIANGDDPMKYGMPFPLVDALRAAIAKATGA